MSKIFASWPVRIACLGLALLLVAVAILTVTTQVKTDAKAANTPTLPGKQVKILNLSTKISEMQLTEKTQQTNVKHKKRTPVIKGKFTEYDVPTPDAGAAGIVMGFDGALWFTEANVGQIGRVTTTGDFDEFVLSADRGPLEIIKGPDHALWFSEANSRIGRITSSGMLTEFVIPTPPDAVDYKASPLGIVLGPDGALWFTDIYFSRVGRLTTKGHVTFFTLPDHTFAQSITVGPDGAIWLGMADDVNDFIGRLTLKGKLTAFQTAGPYDYAANISITAGPDHNLWFVERTGNNVGRLTPSGILTKFPITDLAGPFDIVPGPGKTLLYTGHDNGTIGSITTAGVFKSFSLPGTHSPGIGPYDITHGNGTAYWFTEEETNKIGRIY